MKLLFEYLINRKRNKTISEPETQLLDYYLQSFALLQYFNITINYLSHEKIRKEVAELFPNWTGYEDLYWFYYHYESFGNALYSYKESIIEMLKIVSNQNNKNTKQFFNSDFVITSKINNIFLYDFFNNFLTDNSIKKLLSDRGNSVHEFGQWRSLIAIELQMQRWDSAELIIKNVLKPAVEVINTFNAHITCFINDKIQNL